MGKKKQKQTHLTVADVAKLLGVTRCRVNQMVDNDNYYDYMGTIKLGKNYGFKIPFRDPRQLKFCKNTGPGEKTIIKEELFKPEE